MKRSKIITVILALLLVASGLHAAKEELETIRIVKLKLSPAAEPVPALKHLFIADPAELKHGNAALFYHTAHQIVSGNQEEGDDIGEWMDYPVSKLPRAKIKATLGLAYHQLELGTLRNSCQWELPLEEGFSMLIPQLSGFRDITKLMALEARLQITDSNYNEAIETLRTGLVMALHIGNDVTLIQSLVGISNAKTLLNELERYVGRPDSPNLYWALRSTPRPFINMADTVRFEKAWLTYQFPELKTITTKKMSSSEVMAFAKVLGVLCDNSEEFSNPMLALGWTMLLYPDAKKALIQRGIKPGFVESIPAIQAVLASQYLEYQEITDDVIKWFNLPYWQSRDRMTEAEKRIREVSDFNTKFNVFSVIIPALSRANYLRTRIERRADALCCIESIRMYMANHNGKLPESLSDIIEAPAPLDPITGKEFIYRVDGNKAVLECIAPPDASVKDGVRYEIEVQ